ncbi:hypothetical protein BpHYR1_030070 [Brachionus plicatilis]|uniref:Uncharacterized protein n=1 Tax=Brachionus plicatilis TaxID=10195 RepID=A0A3M7SYE2_BRAPC|nr:hypothetical protein BpHYR1_030070 [Brachionus plicatilis]
MKINLKYYFNPSQELFFELFRSGFTSNNFYTLGLSNTNRFAIYQNFVPGIKTFEKIRPDLDLT